MNQLSLRKCRINHVWLLKIQGNRERHNFPSCHQYLTLNEFAGCKPYHVTDSTILINGVCPLVRHLTEPGELLHPRAFCSHWAFNALITGLIPTGYLALVRRTVQNSPINEKRKSPRLSRILKKLKSSSWMEYVCLRANYAAKSWNLMIKKN